MAVFKCKMCGGALEPAGEGVAECQSCGRVQTVPRDGGERRAALYERAGSLRRAGDFDRAAALYEQVLADDPSDAEAHWSLVLCRWGVDYVEDPATGRRVPTVNRVQATSVAADPDYLRAVGGARGAQRAVYEADAAELDAIQREVLELARREEPYDVFISYKETGADGLRTRDSVLAQDLYGELGRAGLRAFFARVSLEGVLGRAYEPRIYAALRSARVMVVVGTRPEHFEAPWVRNEWSRFLNLMREDPGRSLVPAYRDMDPYDLPREFSHLQAQDMGKLGFMQDLVSGVRKLVGHTEPQVAKPASASKEKAASSNQALIDCMFAACDQGDWRYAEKLAEDTLGRSPTCAEAYLCRLMAQCRLRRREDLANSEVEAFFQSDFRDACRFADASLAAELDGYEEAAKQRRYDRAEETMEGSLLSPDGLDEAALMFASISGYRDAGEQVKRCRELKDEAYDKLEILERCEQRIERVAHSSADLDDIRANKPQKTLKAIRAKLEKLGDDEEVDRLIARCDHLQRCIEQVIADRWKPLEREIDEHLAQAEALVATKSVGDIKLLKQSNEVMTELVHQIDDIKGWDNASKYRNACAKMAKRTSACLGRLQLKVGVFVLVVVTIACLLGPILSIIRS
jgi:hypothetical protein